MMSKKKKKKRYISTHFKNDVTFDAWMIQGKVVIFGGVRRKVENSHFPLLDNLGFPALRVARRARRVEDYVFVTLHSSCCCWFDPLTPPQIPGSSKEKKPSVSKWQKEEHTLYIMP